MMNLAQGSLTFLQSRLITKLLKFEFFQWQKVLIVVNSITDFEELWFKIICFTWSERTGWFQSYEDCWEKSGNLIRCIIKLQFDRDRGKNYECMSDSVCCFQLTWGTPFLLNYVALLGSSVNVKTSSHLLSRFCKLC